MRHFMIANRHQIREERSITAKPYSGKPAGAQGIGGYESAGISIDGSDQPGAGSRRIGSAQKLAIKRGFEKLQGQGIVQNFYVRHSAAGTLRRKGRHDRSY